MKYTAGFIGCGNMGGALAKAVSKYSKNILIYDKDGEKAQKFAKSIKATYVSGTKELCENCKFIFLGVKPNIIPFVCDEIKPYISDENIIITMAAGVKISLAEEKTHAKNIIRIMPNTPCQTGAGMVLYCANKGGSENTAEFLALMKYAGKIDNISDRFYYWRKLCRYSIFNKRSNYK